MIKLNGLVTICCHACGMKSEYVAERFDCKINANKHTYTFTDDCFCGIAHNIRFTATTDSAGAVQGIADESEDCNLVNKASLDFVSK